MELKIQCPGYEIAADWYEGADDSKILIVLPGYSSSKKRQRVHSEAMVRATSTSALAVDFSGHGNSPFKLRDTRPAQHFLELICIFDWLKQRHPSAEISVSGSSYGGFLAVQLTQYRDFKNLVLRAPAMYPPSELYDPWSNRIDNEEDYNKRVTDYRQDTQALAMHPLLSKASTFHGRVLVVTHENDEIVPRETTDAYADTFNADKFLAKGFQHTIDKDTLNEDQLRAYQDKIASWLNQS